MSTDVDIAVLETRMGALTDSIKRVEGPVDRLPSWAVWIMIAGGGVIGFMVNWLISCLKP